MIQDNRRISTVNHKDIQTWASSTKMRPVQLRRFKDETIIDRLKFRFPEERYPDEEDLAWDTFFDIFDQEQLEFVMEDIADEAVEHTNVYEFRPRGAW
ncbi:MAG: hypothetical protein AAF849_19270 [Bacteroidota bacterium]